MNPIFDDKQTLYSFQFSHSAHINHSKYKLDILFTLTKKKPTWGKNLGQFIVSFDILFTETLGPAKVLIIEVRSARSYLETWLDQYSKLPSSL